MPDIHYTMCKDVSALLTWSYDSYTGVPGMAGGSSELTLLRSDCDCAPGSPTTWMMGVSVGGPYPHRALEQKTVWQLPVTNLVLRLLQEELRCNVDAAHSSSPQVLSNYRVLLQDVMHECC